MAIDSLAPRVANFAALTPVSFIRRSARVYGEMLAVVDGDTRLTYSEFGARCGRLAAGLAARGIGLGDVVSVLTPNSAMMLEAHFGVPWVGAILNTLNARLDATVLAACLDDARSRLLIVDRSLVDVARQALSLCAAPADLFVAGGCPSYESLLAPPGTPEPPMAIADEWQSISLNYTSGTTSKPKGVLYHHRGAYLTSLGNVSAFRLGTRPVYGWTLPMFHCNGWCNTWSVTMLGGTHICLRKIDGEEIFRSIDAHGITHMSGAPIILNMLSQVPDELRRKSSHMIEFTVGAASPPAAILERMEQFGFNVQHSYGLTETYGPALSCDWHPAWDRQSITERAAIMSRQGVNVVALEDAAVLDPATMEPVPHDGQTMGEIMMRGNTVMKGYHNAPQATEEAMAGGWFHSGDLAVVHPDGYAQIRDRAKDIIISGGENISSLEIESALFRHESVLEAAVVAKPDGKWGEVPCAFVTLKPDAAISVTDIVAFCRLHLASFKLPKAVIFGPLPKTATGKVQKNLLREQARSLP